VRGHGKIKSKVTKKKRKGSVTKGTSYREEDILIDQLEELAERFRVKIRYEPVKQEEDSVNIVGGLCLLKGEYVLIIDSKKGRRDKIRTLAAAVKQFDLDQIHIRPVLRELLDDIPEERPLMPKGMRRRRK
jgi:hypothetical protein